MAQASNGKNKYAIRARCICGKVVFSKAGAKAQVKRANSSPKEIRVHPDKSYTGFYRCTLVDNGTWHVTSQEGGAFSG